MIARYLLDTNMASYVIKGNFPPVRERLLKVPMAEVGISAVTEAELRFGVVRKPEAVRLRAAVEEFLLRVEVLPWDSMAAQSYAQVRAALERAGEPMGNLDMMIAAQALAVQAVLVTHDRVFRRVKGLKIEDWTKA
ncbi:MAG: type II toxin-antitoxin system VapC family toxin [Terriglobales bacterium]